MNASINRHPGLNLHDTDRHTHETAEPVIFGFWVFLMADLLIFALLFATYAAMSVNGIADGPKPGDVFELRSAFIETMLLLASSFTFGMSSLGLKYDRGLRRLVFWLLVTFALGAAFVGMEIHDFAKMAGENATPQRSGFLSAFFTLVATHGLHVSAGLLWMLVMFVQLAVFGLDGSVKLKIMRLALFWHMLDIVWVCIFTFVYLRGLS
jgi:cytochrome o ubiquinol oxidase subunit 3